MEKHSNKNSMKVQVVWNIRDARGFTTYEKTFLFIVASRGTVKCLRQTLLNDMACSTGQLSKVVNSLHDKGVINVYEGYWKDGKKSQTSYSINEEVLASFVPDRSQDEGVRSYSEPVRSYSELPSSYSERVRSCSGGYKGTIKETLKVTSKETIKTGAPAKAETPASSLNSSQEDVLSNNLRSNNMNNNTEDTYVYLGSLDLKDFPSLSLTEEVLSYTYLVNDDGVLRTEVSLNENETDLPLIENKVPEFVGAGLTENAQADFAKKKQEAAARLEAKKAGMERVEAPKPLNKVDAAAAAKGISLNTDEVRMMRNYLRVSGFVTPGRVLTLEEALDQIISNREDEF